MKKLVTLATIALLIATTGLAQNTDTNNIRNNSLTGFNPFSTVENFVEKAEVGFAGVIGGSDLKAKAMANNAEESLQKAEKVAERNPDRAKKLVDKYDRNINKSKNLAAKGKDSNLSNKLENISNQNTERLEKVKQKVPEEAKKGIENAIENSRRNGKMGESRKVKEQSARDNSSIPKAGGKKNISGEKDTPGNKNRRVKDLNDSKNSSKDIAYSDVRNQTIENSKQNKSESEEHPETSNSSDDISEKPEGNSTTELH